MKLQKLVEEESQFFKTREEVEAWLKKMNIESYTINEDLTVDVNGDVDIMYKNISVLPIKFKNVAGHFSCSGNNLTSLEGCPREVGGDFYCSFNNLTSLKGAPREVDGGFYCSGNNLTSLEDGPKEVGGSFYCADNNLTSLEGAPREVSVGFIALLINSHL